MKEKGEINQKNSKKGQIFIPLSTGEILNIGLDVKIHCRSLYDSSPYYGWMIRQVRNWLDQAENAVLNSLYSTWRSTPGTLSMT